MLTISKNITLNGLSVIDGTTVATMYASSGDSFNTNINIINKEVYETNKDTVMADIAEFNEQAYALIGDTDITENTNK